jgi:hypothetical protein
MLIDSLTVEERERLAYIEGFTEASNLLARLDDCHRSMAQAAIEYANLAEENERLQLRIRWGDQ